MAEPASVLDISVPVKGPLAVPRHLGLILDGNRRWARERGLPVMEGHRRGYFTLKDVALEALEQGVEYLSAYVFSTENWNRNQGEVDYLMKLVLWIMKNEVEEFHRRNIRLRVVGSEERLSSELLEAIRAAENKTRNNTGGTLLLCFNYGGQQEIADAMKKIVEAGTPAADVTPELIGRHLYAPGVPPVDLIIRTSGEQRLSNFLLWQGAYSELMFTDTYWPDFSKHELEAMFIQYSHRQRRHGK